MKGNSFFCTSLISELFLCVICDDYPSWHSRNSFPFAPRLSPKMIKTQKCVISLPSLAGKDIKNKAELDFYVICKKLAFEQDNLLFSSISIYIEYPSSCNKTWNYVRIITFFCWCWRTASQGVRNKIYMHIKIRES